MPRNLAKKQMKQKYITILNYVARVIIGNGLMMFVPLILLPFYQGEIRYFWALFLPATFFVLFGFILKEYTNTKEKIILNFKEGGVLVILAWMVSILICTTPFMTIEGMSFTLSTFEAVSGLTTTGLTVVDVEIASRLIVFWRSIMQLVGGAGIAIIMISAIIGPQGMGIYLAEGRSDKLIPNIIQSTKLILQIYVVYIVIGIILYIIAGMTVFDAINHSFSAVSTGGFSTKNANIGYYDSPAIELISMILMILGSINFAAQFILLKGSVGEFLEIGEVRFKFTIFAIAVPLVTYFGTINTYSSFGASARDSIFAVVSAFTTTGFTTTSYAGWHQFALFVLIVLMAIGGGYGSTSGGIKMFRIHVLLKSVYWQFERYFLPQNVVREDYVVRADGKYFLNNAKLIDIANFIAIYLGFFILMNFIYLALGFSLLQSMFETATVLSGVGLSIGITSAASAPIMLWAQIFGMILGRLEFLVVFVGITKIFRDMKIYNLRG